MDSKLKELRELNLKETKRLIRDSTGKDDLIIQAINSIDEIKGVANKLSGRVRYWYELYLPEVSRQVHDHERLIDLILSKDKATLITEFNIEDTMGAEIEPTDVEAIQRLAKEIKSLYLSIEDLKLYIDEAMQSLCPNIHAITGPLIGAKLMQHAGSLKKLSQMPSSTVQLLGAEKALFRHLRTGARCPKYGLILQHKLVNGAQEKAKAARMVADKISIASKVDFFKGEFIGDALRKQLEAKIK